MQFEGIFLLFLLNKNVPLTCLFRGELFILTIAYAIMKGRRRGVREMPPWKILKFELKSVQLHQLD